MKFPENTDTVHIQYSTVQYSTHLPGKRTNRSAPCSSPHSCASGAMLGVSTARSHFRSLSASWRSAIHLTGRWHRAEFSSSSVQLEFSVSALQERNGTCTSNLKPYNLKP
eukprot:421628-Prorocentrum_minimum.AAC.2